ncbi:type VI secretion system Vgr family protein [Pseudomonas japonica]|uniref:type VI secretion system Vgr family protein n=1 Tax=Pseudomonas japonica TaxID=256466 RepID=UPI0015E40801|nr:type VI secretion system tip protein TssI/VgrG [Pseudomonas japonica]MBA1241195.1 type VI secretion system tip protein VgrG [Pseudomonas japonica]
MPNSLLPLFTSQENRLLKLKTGLKLHAELMIASFSGGEGLSEDFGFKLDLISPNRNIKLKSVLGQSVTVEIALNRNRTRYINGIITGFGKRSTDDNTCHYTALMGSWLSLLEQRHNSRIFQDKTVVDVITEIFQEYQGLANYRFRITAPLKPRSYITQYRESDYHFVLRLLESEGLLFYFEHDPDSHTLVILDDSSRLTALPEQPVIPFDMDSRTSRLDSIIEWNAARALHSGSMTTQTFDYRQPRNRLPVYMKTVTEQGEAPTFELYDYMGHYTHKDYNEGEALVRRRIELLELGGKAFEGKGDCRALRPGYTFELSGHYEHDQGSPEDRNFLPMSIKHTGVNNYLDEVEAQYFNTFECVRSKIPFRPALNTLRPTINGPQTAIIVGPKGEEIYTDELGRVKIQFHWDRYGRNDDMSSCWVRVAQPAASGGFGHISVPRVGDEVVVEFLDGDPDRPLITGSLYNSVNLPPWQLPANKARSGFMTRSLKGNGSNASFLSFDDRDGAERICLHAERDLLTEVEADEHHRVAGNRRIEVDGSHSETVKRDISVSAHEGTYSVTAENGAVTISAATSITLEVGSSRLRMHENGMIDLSGILVYINGSTAVHLNK